MAPPKIANVFTFPDLHEVVGHARARPSSSAGSEQVEVEVVLAPVGTDHRFGPGSAAVSEWIGCGELASVPVGSRWRKGRPAGSRRVPDRFVGEGTIKTISTMSLQGWDGGKGAASFPIGAAAAGRCFVFELEGGAFRKVVVPVTEVVRTLFGRTSDLLLQLYGGRVPESPGRFQIPEKAEVPDVKGVLTMRYASRPSRQEALLAAMVLTDEVLHASFHDVRRGLVSAQGWQNASGSVVSTSCPFKQETKLGYEGRTIARTSGGHVSTIFLVTRILSASYVPAFKILEVRFPSARVDPEAPPRDESVRIGPVDTIYVRAERDPAPGRPVLEIETPGTALDFVTGVGFRLLPDEPTSIRPQPSYVVEDDRDDAQGSAGDAVTGGDRDTRRVVTRDEDKLQGPDPRKVSMEATDAAIKALLAKCGWKASYRRVSSFENLGQGFHVLLVGVLVDKVEVMICDGGESAIEPRAIGLIRKLDGSGFDAGSMTKLRGFILKENAHWQRKGGLASTNGWAIATIRRDVDPMKHLDVYAERIAASIRKLASG